MREQTYWNCYRSKFHLLMTLMTLTSAINAIFSSFYFAHISVWPLQRRTSHQEFKIWKVFILFTSFSFVAVKTPKTLLRNIITTKYKTKRKVKTNKKSVAVDE